jgi:4-amino-4-deoxy-L-arabinose transferase-like glycosyltransferase
VSLAFVDRDVLSGCSDRAGGGKRRRWALWRSPEGQPAWARPVLLGIAAVAAILYGWEVTRAGLAPIYSVAVKSMSESWRAFFFGAFDPKASVTMDKLAGSFLPQALSARIFGFHPWSVALPQAIEGVITVLVMYRVVRRWAGVAPGLLAAGITTITPVLASMFGHSMEDGALTMCLVLAADAYQRAVGEARLRPLVWSGVWVGLGFQAKMLEAWMVLPALAIGYLVAAPGPLRRRLWQLCAAGAVMLAVSLSWIAAYTLIPASDRPYVDGSTNNSAVAMVFGYNGLERFGLHIPGAVTSAPGSGTGGAPVGRGPAGRGGTGTGPAGGALPRGIPASGQGGVPSGFPRGVPGGQADVPRGGFPGAGNSSAPGGSTQLGGAPGGGIGGNGWTKLLGSRFGPEVGWLYPLAVLALVLGLVWRRRTPRTDQVRGGFVMWGGWLATFALIYSKMSFIPHTAYVSALAPAVAALSAAGIVMLWRLYRAGDRRGWLLPAIVLTELAWTWFLWHSHAGFLPWVLWTATAAGVAAVVVLAAARTSGQVRTRLVTAGMAAGVAAMLAAPAAWALSVLDTRYAGSSFDAGAGPVSGGGFGGGGPGPGGASSGGPGGGSGGLGTSTTLTAAEQKLYRYLTAHRDGASYLMAVQSWSAAAPYIMATGQEVMPMGGFSGSVPEPSVAHVRQLVARGQLRFLMIGGGTGPGAGQAVSTAADGGPRAVARWVQSACTKVPAKAYGGTAASGGPGSFGGFGDGETTTGTLYRCGRNG